jgi:hypothetical protein
MRTTNWLPLLLIGMALSACSTKPVIKYVATPPPKLRVSEELMRSPESPPARQKWIDALQTMTQPAAETQ